MYMKLLITGLSLLCISCGVLAVKRENKNPPFMWPETVYDIYSQNSGDGPIITDDEDLVDGSGDGSGSGDGKIETEITTLQPTVALTACQRDRLNSSSEADKPRCTESGQYEKLQCAMKRKKKECWCVDLTNTEITGTRMKYPTEPDCETGKNLKLCVSQLLKKRHGLLGVYEPHCTFEGEFEKIQCHGAACWCVDAQGLEQLGTRVYKPAVPKCKEPTTSTESPTTPAPRPVYTKVITLAPTYKSVTKRPTHGDKDKKNNNKNNLLPDDTDIKPDDSDDDDDDDNDTGIDEDDTDLMGKPQKQNLSLFKHIMAKPGLLAAVIGGAVVGLLCAVLLVMFIVYRMRKKDEGSYPLDEQKFTNYSYMKANDKEFYA